jgi:hypothetical protein
MNFNLGVKSVKKEENAATEFCLRGAVMKSKECLVPQHPNGLLLLLCLSQLLLPRQACVTHRRSRGDGVGRSVISYNDCTGTCTYIYANMYNIFKHTYEHLHTLTRTCLYVHTHTHTHTHTHIHTHTHTHTQMIILAATSVHL